MADVSYNAEFKITAVDNASASIKSVADNLGRLQNEAKQTQWTMNTAWNSASWFGASIWSLGKYIKGAAIAGAVYKIWNSILELWKNYELAKVSFTTMLGSAEKAEEMLADLSDFAKKTPFELTEIRENAKQLLAMWVNAKDMIPTMKALWDVSAGLGVDMSRLALNYGQVLTQWKLTWAELKDFTRMWVPLISQLAKQFWVAESAISDMVSKGQIWAEDVVQAFQEMTSEWWKFADLMYTQSATLEWKISNLKDELAWLWETIGNAVIPRVEVLWDDVKHFFDAPENPLEEEIYQLQQDMKLLQIDMTKAQDELNDLNDKFRAWKMSVADYADAYRRLNWLIETYQDEINDASKKISENNAKLEIQEDLNKRVEKSVKLSTDAQKALQDQQKKLREEVNNWTISQEEYDEAMAKVKTQTDAVRDASKLNEEQLEKERRITEALSAEWATAAEIKDIISKLKIENGADITALNNEAQAANNAALAYLRKYQYELLANQTKAKERLDSVKWGLLDAAKAATSWWILDKAKAWWKLFVENYAAWIKNAYKEWDWFFDSIWNVFSSNKVAKWMVQNITTELSDAQKAYDNATKELDEFNKMISDNDAYIRDAADAMSKATEWIAWLATETENATDATNENTDATNKNNNTRSWSSKKATEDAKAATEAIKEQYENLKDGMENANDRFKEALEKHEELREKCEDAVKDYQDQIEDFRDEIKDLQEDLKDLNEELDWLYKDRSTELADSLLESQDVVDKYFYKMWRGFEDMKEVAQSISSRELQILDWQEEKEYMWYAIRDLQELKKAMDNIESFKVIDDTTWLWSIEDMVKEARWRASKTDIQWITEEYQAKIDETKTKMDEIDAQIVDKEAKIIELEDKIATIQQAQTAALEERANEIEWERVNYWQRATEKLEYEREHQEELKLTYNALNKNTAEIQKQQQLMAQMLADWREMHSWWWADWARADWWPVSAWRTYLVGERWPELFTPDRSWTIIPNNEITNNNGIEINMWWVVVRSDADINAITDEIVRKIKLEKNFWIS